MTIEIVVGLLHLNNGPILARAKLMQQPMLISANCLSRWRDRGGWRNWEGWRQGQLGNATGLRSLDLDSAGYVLTSSYGGMPWSIADYMGLAANYHLDPRPAEALPSATRTLATSTASTASSGPLSRIR